LLPSLVAYFFGVLHTAKSLAHHDDLRIWEQHPVIIDSTTAAYEFTESSGSACGQAGDPPNSPVTTRPFAAAVTGPTVQPLCETLLHLSAVVGVRYGSGMGQMGEDQGAIPDVAEPVQKSPSESSAPYDVAPPLPRESVAGKPWKEAGRSHLAAAARVEASSLQSASTSSDQARPAQHGPEPGRM
jgi:hypothetical protein